MLHEAIDGVGHPEKEIGFVCSGSLDYLQGGPFAFVAGLDAVGAWPPIRESHVEMDAAWALYEAWVAIQTGEVDSALIYGFGKSSPGDLHEIMTLQHDPYYVLPLWPSMVDMAAMQARAYLDASGATESDLAEVAARSQRNGRSNPHAVRKGNVTADDVLEAAGHARPAARRRHRSRSPTARPRSCSRPATSPARCAKRPAWIRGIEHRIEAHSLGVRDLTHVGVDPRRRHRGRSGERQASTSPSCTRSSATKS